MIYFLTKIMKDKSNRLKQILYISPLNIYVYNLILDMLSFLKNHLMTQLDCLGKM